MTRQAARAHAREAQHGAPPAAAFLDLLAGALAVAVRDAMAAQQTQPGCAVCVHEAKVAEQIATKALEPFAPHIRQSITVIGGRPVCWEHADEPQLVIQSADQELTPDQLDQFRRGLHGTLKAEAASRPGVLGKA